MTITTHTPLAVNIKDESFFKEPGIRTVHARKERHITQVHLAATPGIARQTLAHCEGRWLRLSASLRAALAPHMERISELRGTQQRFVIQMSQTVLMQPGR